MSSNDQLPPGWSAEWLVPPLDSRFAWSFPNPKLQECGAPTVHVHRYTYPQKLQSASHQSPLENSTGHRQWEHPEQHPDIEGPLPSTPAYAHHPKRRQYAAGQSDAYTGASAPPFSPGFQPQIHQPVGGPQFFTPGASDQYPSQSQQPYQGGDYTQTPNMAGFPRSPTGYERSHQRQGSVAVNQLAGQLQQMNVSQPSYGQQPVCRLSLCCVCSAPSS